MGYLGRSEFNNMPMLPRWSELVRHRHDICLTGIGAIFSLLKNLYLSGAFLFYAPFIAGGIRGSYLGCYYLLQ